MREIATRFGRDRETVARWINDGCPVLRRADRARGVSWLLDPAAVVDWLEGRGSASAAARDRAPAFDPALFPFVFACSLADDLSGPIVGALAECGVKNPQTIARAVCLIQLLLIEKARAALEDAGVRVPATFPPTSLMALTMQGGLSAAAAAVREHLAERRASDDGAGAGESAAVLSDASE